MCVFEGSVVVVVVVVVAVVLVLVVVNIPLERETFFLFIFNLIFQEILALNLVYSLTYCFVLAGGLGGQFLFSSVCLTPSLQHCIKDRSRFSFICLFVSVLVFLLLFLVSGCERSPSV